MIKFVSGKYCCSVRTTWKEIKWGDQLRKYFSNRDEKQWYLKWDFGGRGEENRVSKLYLGAKTDREGCWISYSR